MLKTTESGGAGIAARAQWYSFSNRSDMENFRTNKATISGEQNAVSLSIGISWRGFSFSASRVYSFATLAKLPGTP